MLLRLNLVEQVGAFINHLMVITIALCIIIVIMIVVGSIVTCILVEIIRVCISTKIIQINLKDHQSNLNLTTNLVILVSTLCVIITAFSNSLSIKLLLPVLVGSSVVLNR